MGRLIAWPEQMLIVVAIVSGWLMTWAARLLAPHLNLVDKPDGGRKRHRQPTPLMGGCAVYGALLTALIVCRVVPSARLNALLADVAWSTGFLLSAGLICAVGLWDDRFPMRPRQKFIGQLLATLPFLLACPVVGRVELLGASLELGPLAIPFAMFWLVMCVNVVNLIDGMDGLASTVGLVAMVSIGILSLMLDQPGLATLCFVAAGGVVGFLVHNLPPARIFLGDAGSMTIGFLVGALALRAADASSLGFSLAIWPAFLSVPLFDTSMAIVRRGLTGRSISQADRSHFHHQLQDHGLSRRMSLLVVAAISLGASTAAIAAVQAGSDWPVLVVGAIVCCGLIAGRIFGHREWGLAVQQSAVVVDVVNDAQHRWQQRLMRNKLEAASDDNFEDVWSAATEFVAAIGAAELTIFQREQGQNVLPLTPRVERTWTAADHTATKDPDWRLRCHVEIEPGRQIVVQAQGHSPLSPNSPLRFDALSQVLGQLCEAAVPQFADSSRRSTLPQFPGGDVERRAA